jgi:hypothetical protein
MSCPRPLLIVSQDYGELSAALALIEGQGFNAALALPPRFASATPGLRTHHYSSLADLLGAVDRERPDAVLLFSGYLLAINDLLDLADAGSLVTAIRRRSIPLATTDPFLGALSTVSSDTFADAHPRKERLTRHFNEVSRILSDVPHIYPVAPPPAAGPRALSFHNPLACGAPSASSNKPSWLFVLSAEDFAAQTARIGVEQFSHRLRQRLTDALRHGRGPILVAPEPCIAALGHDDALKDALLLPFCPPAAFRPLLLAAECAFYWNIVSNSLLPRVINRLPVFFFDRGHLLHAVPALHAAAVHHYYLGAEPPVLAMGDPLDSAALGDLASDHLRDMAPTVAHIRAQPTPHQMLEQLLAQATHAA